MWEICAFTSQDVIKKLCSGHSIKTMIWDKNKVVLLSVSTLTVSDKSA